MSYLDQDHRDAPDVRSLWDRSHVARKAGRTCAVCREPIEPGQKYSSSGTLIDGKFSEWIRHYGGELYPSGCPKIAARDRAELEAQFREDERLWNPPAAGDAQ